MKAIVLDKLTDKTYKTNSKRSEKQTREEANVLIDALCKRYKLEENYNRFEIVCIEYQKGWYTMKRIKL